MFSVIVPTIWSSNKINNLISKLDQCNVVGEIILINNNPSVRIFGSIGKTIEYLFYENKYVNPSWNFGVEVSKYDKICIINDDIDIDISSFYYMDQQLNNSEIGIVGISKLCYTERSIYSLEKMLIRNKGWGCAIFLKKSNYHRIPDDLKIWFGDDWLIKMNEGKCYRIIGPKVDTDMSQSVNLPQVKEIIDQDVKNSTSYNLPWSNDY